MLEPLKKFYYLLENTYYELIEGVDTIVPITNSVDRIEKIVPSFPIISAFVLIALMSLFVFVPSGLAGGYYSVQFLTKSDGSPIQELVVFLDGDSYTTNEMGKIQIAEIGTKRLIVQDSKFEEKDTYIEITNEPLIIYLGEKKDTETFVVSFFDSDTKKPHLEEKYMIIKCESGDTINKRFEDSEISLKLKDCSKPVAKISSNNYKDITKTLQTETKVYLEKEVSLDSLLQVKVLLENQGIENAQVEAFNKSTEKRYTGITGSAGITEIKVPEGEYILTATTDIGGTGYSEINIAEGEVLPVQINLNQNTEGELGDKKISFELKKDGELEISLIKIYEKGKSTVLFEAEDSSYSHLVTDSIYQVFIYHNGYISAFDLELFDSSSTEKQTINLNEGQQYTLKTIVIDEEEQIISNAKISYYFKSIPEVKIGEGEEIKLRSGEYIVIAETDNETKTEEINLTEDSELKIQLVTGKGGIEIEVYDYDTKIKIHEVYTDIEANIILYNAGTEEIYLERNTVQSIAEIENIPADKTLALKVSVEGLGTEFYKEVIDIQNNKTKKIKIYIGETINEISFLGILNNSKKGTEISPEKATTYYLEFRLPDKGTYYIETVGTEKISFNNTEGLVLDKRYSCNQPISECLETGVYTSPLVELEYSYNGATNVLVKIKVNSLEEGTAIPIYYYKEGNEKKLRTIIVGERTCTNDFTILLETPEEIIENSNFDLEYSLTSCKNDTQAKLQIIAKYLDSEILDKEVYNGTLIIDNPITGIENISTTETGTIEIQGIVKDMQNNILQQEIINKEIVSGEKIVLDCPGKLYKEDIMELECRAKDSEDNYLEAVLVQIENISATTTYLTNAFSDAEGKFSFQIELEAIDIPQDNLILKAYKANYAQAEKTIPLSNLQENINSNICTEIVDDLIFETEDSLQFAVRNICSNRIELRINSEIFGEGNELKTFILDSGESQLIQFTEPLIIGAYPLYLEETKSGIENKWTKTIVYKGDLDWISFTPEDFIVNKSAELENLYPIGIDFEHPQLSITANSRNYGNFNLDNKFTMIETKIENRLNELENKNLGLIPYGNSSQEGYCQDLSSLGDISLDNLEIGTKNLVNLYLYNRTNTGEEKISEYSNYKESERLIVFIANETEETFDCGFALKEEGKKDYKPGETVEEITYQGIDPVLVFGKTCEELEENGWLKCNAKTKLFDSINTQFDFYPVSLESSEDNLRTCVNYLQENYGSDFEEKLGIVIPEINENTTNSVCLEQSKEENLDTYYCNILENKNPWKYETIVFKASTVPSKGLEITIPANKEYEILLDSKSYYHWRYTESSSKTSVIGDSDFEIGDRTFTCNNVTPFAVLVEENGNCRKAYQDKGETNTETKLKFYVNDTKGNNNFSDNRYNIYVTVRYRDKDITETDNIEINKEIDKLCIKPQKLSIGQTSVSIAPIIIDKLAFTAIKQIPSYSTDNKITITFNNSEKVYALLDFTDYVQETETYKEPHNCSLQIKCTDSLSAYYENPFSLEITLLETEISKTQEIEIDCSKDLEVSSISEEFEYLLDGEEITVTRKNPNPEYELRNAKFRILLDSANPEFVKEEIKVKYENNWNNISADFCNPEKNTDYKVCDSSQFLIVLMKNLMEETNLETLKNNGYVMQIALMQDNYNQDLRNDFSEYYAQQLEDWTKYLESSENLLFTADNGTEIEAGIYNLKVDIDYINGESFIWMENPNANIEISLTKISDLENAFYKLPINKGIGIENGQANRDNYGLVFTAPIFSEEEDGEVYPTGFAGKTIRVNENSELDKVVGLNLEETIYEINTYQKTIIPLLCASNYVQDLPLFASGTGICSPENTGIMQSEIEEENIENLLSINLSDYKYIYYLISNGQGLQECNGEIIYLQKSDSNENQASNERDTIATKNLFGYELKSMQDLVDEINNENIIKKENTYYWNKNKILEDAFLELIPEGYAICTR